METKKFDRKGHIVLEADMIEVLDEIRFLIGITPEINKEITYKDIMDKIDKIIKKATE